LDWYELTEKYHKQTLAHDCRLDSLSHEWERELAALCRLEADVNHGGYLGFFSNWGRECYVIASQALRKIGARRTADLIDGCQALLDEHFNSEGASQEQRRMVLPNPIIAPDCSVIKRAGSVLPDAVVDRIIELSYEFMDYPEDVAQLGLKYYRRHFEE
jgi:hypothetical protein